jgi:hypothetical protein
VKPAHEKSSARFLNNSILKNKSSTAQENRLVGMDALENNCSAQVDFSPVFPVQEAENISPKDVIRPYDIVTFVTLIE